MSNESKFWDAVVTAFLLPLIFITIWDWFQFDRAIHLGPVNYWTAFGAFFLGIWIVRALALEFWEAKYLIEERKRNRSTKERVK